MNLVAVPIMNTDIIKPINAKANQIKVGVNTNHQLIANTLNSFKNTSTIVIMFKTPAFMC